MGPDDTYMLQYDADVSHFWADRDELALGACFEPVIRQRAATIIPRQIVTEVTCASLFTVPPYVPILGHLRIASDCDG